jgi:multiple sugar transport system permease protein
VPQAVRRRAALRRLLAGVAIVAVAAAALALVNASLHYAAPADMRKLHSPGWLSDGDPMPSAVPFAPSWALWALVIMALWSVGQMAVIYLAKLQDVPVELYEAADIDGAGWLQKTWQITLPMISPVILFNVVMAIIGTFQVFAEPYIMTSGGPEDKTRLIAMFVYDQAFQYQRVGYASAVAWILFIMIVTLTLLAFRISQKRVYYAGR